MRKGLGLVILSTAAPVIGASAVAALALSFGMGSPRSAAAQAIQRHTAPRIHVRDGRDSTSINWSGYATTGATYTDVKGSWTQPTATCGAGQTAYSSFWVGIDGDTTNIVEQTGTDADCSSGTPTYYA